MWLLLSGGLYYVVVVEVEVEVEMEVAKGGYEPCVGGDGSGG